MKKLSLCIALAVFGMVSALQAGDGCCPASKEAKGECPMKKQAEVKQGAPSCCPKAAAAAKAKAAKTEPTKGAGQLVKKS